MANQDNTPQPHELPRFGPPQHLDYWDGHPDFPSEDWQYEVANGDTREGYWTWVHYQVKAAEE